MTTSSSSSATSAALSRRAPSSSRNDDRPDHRRASFHHRELSVVVIVVRTTAPVSALLSAVLPIDVDVDNDDAATTEMEDGGPRHPVVVAWNRRASGRRIRRRRTDASSIAPHCPRQRRRRPVVPRSRLRRWREDQSFRIAPRRRVLRVRHLPVAAAQRPVVRCPAAPAPPPERRRGRGQGGGIRRKPRTHGPTAAANLDLKRCIRNDEGECGMRASRMRIVLVPPPPPGRSRLA